MMIQHGELSPASIFAYDRKSISTNDDVAIELNIQISKL